ncbi:MAG: hypothetical protein MUF15_27375 [Acidobacteria bacterium]|jgi:hypothetical protein|nr:hypothetical protein [Acidobacteriota bacterium]
MKKNIIEVFSECERKIQNGENVNCIRKLEGDLDLYFLLYFYKGMINPENYRKIMELKMIKEKIFNDECSSTKLDNLSLDIKFMSADFISQGNMGSTLKM